MRVHRRRRATRYAAAIPMRPLGFRRRGAVCFVAAPRRCTGIGLRRGASHPAPRRPERDPAQYSDRLLEGSPAGGGADLVVRHVRLHLEEILAILRVVDRLRRVGAGEPKVRRFYRRGRDAR